MSLVTPMFVCGFCFLRAVFFFPFFFFPFLLHAATPAVITDTTKESVLWRRAAVQLDAAPTREHLGSGPHLSHAHHHRGTAAVLPRPHWRLNNRNQFRPQSNYWGEFGVCVGGGTWAAVTAGRLLPRPPPTRRPLPRRDGRRTLSVNHCTAYAQR